MEVPEPEIDGDAPRQVLVGLDHEWIEATEALIAHRSYGDEP
jgi:hypothetical protein